MRSRSPGKKDPCSWGPSPHVPFEWFNFRHGIYNVGKREWWDGGGRGTYVRGPIYGRIHSGAIFNGFLEGFLDFSQKCTWKGQR